MEIIEGKTPNGGVRLEISYYDENWNEVEKNDAYNIVIREIGVKGELLFETYGTSTPKTEV